MKVTYLGNCRTLNKGNVVGNLSQYPSKSLKEFIMESNKDGHVIQLKP